MLETIIAVVSLVIPIIVYFITVRSSAAIQTRIERPSATIHEDRPLARAFEQLKGCYPYLIPKVGTLMLSNCNGATLTMVVIEEPVEFYPGDGVRRCSGWRPCELIGTREMYVFLGAVHEEQLTTGIRWVGCYLRCHDGKIVYAHDYAMEEVK